MPFNYPIPFRAASPPTPVRWVGMVVDNFHLPVLSEGYGQGWVASNFLVPTLALVPHVPNDSPLLSEVDGEERPSVSHYSVTSILQRL